jgi:HEAT repeat protein
MDKDFIKMVADYMDAGFLENIEAMLRQDKGLFGLIPVLLRDERQRVRIGAVALIEGFLGECKAEVEGQVEKIGEILKTEPDKVVKCDAIYALSVIGGGEVRLCLKAALEDPDPIIREEAREALEELK